MQCKVAQLYVTSNVSSHKVHNAVLELTSMLGQIIANGLDLNKWRVNFVELDSGRKSDWMATPFLGVF